MLYNTSASNIAKLQRAQNALARVVSFTRRTEHIRPVLQQLHWLPVSYRIDYKIATLAYKVLKTGCPDYLRQSVHFYTPSRHLRSTNQLLLSKPTTKTVISSRAFSRAAPTTWNSLPYDIPVDDSFGRTDGQNCDSNTVRCITCSRAVKNYYCEIIIPRAQRPWYRCATCARVNPTLRVKRRTIDREVPSSTPVLLSSNLRQVVHTLVPLSPSSINWYRCENREVNLRLWERCGLPSITWRVLLTHVVDGPRSNKITVTVSSPHSAVKLLDSSLSSNFTRSIVVDLLYNKSITNRNKRI